MFRFLVLEDGRSAERWPLRNAYMIGSDGSAVAAQIWFEPGMIVCETREAGTAALALQYRVGNIGEFTLQTCLLPDRDQPYLLCLELARHRVMTLYAKLEDWAMFDLDSDHPVSKQADLSRKLFIEALSTQDLDASRTAGLAQESLVSALDGTEELAMAHSQLLLSRRKATAALGPEPLGCGVELDHTHERQRCELRDNVDFLQLPTPWKQLAPAEGDYQWQLADSWAEWAAGHRMPVVAGPLVSLEPAHLPAWLYIWEHDYDTVRDLIYEHVERVVERYKHAFTTWNVVSGLHVNSHFTFNFEQLMDLTRMTTMLVKKLAPSAAALVEIRQPFGEYYGSNQRSIPPMMYADLITQSAVPFDGFAIRLLMGQARPGHYTRDLMQISSLLDQYSVFGKPLHLTVAAPSEPVTEAMIAAPESDQPVDPNCGYWRQPWSAQVQSHWLETVFQIAMSKPFIERVAWQVLIDHPEVEMPLAGLINEALEPKWAFRRLVDFRRGLFGQGAAT